MGVKQGHTYTFKPIAEESLSTRTAIAEGEVVLVIMNRYLRRYRYPAVPGRCWVRPIARQSLVIVQCYEASLETSKQRTRVARDVIDPEEQSDWATEAQSVDVAFQKAALALHGREVACRQGPVTGAELKAFEDAFQAAKKTALAKYQTCKDGQGPRPDTDDEPRWVTYRHCLTRLAAHLDGLHDALNLVMDGPGLAPLSDEAAWTAHEAIEAADREITAEFARLKRVLDLTSERVDDILELRLDAEFLQIQKGLYGEVERLLGDRSAVRIRQYGAPGWIEGIGGWRTREGFFDADQDASEVGLTFLRSSWLELPEQAGEEVRRVRQDEPGAPARVSHIPWSDVKWVCLEPVSSLSPGVAADHSEVLGSSTDRNVVGGYLIDLTPGGEFFRLIGTELRSSVQWIEIFEAACVEVKPGASAAAWLRGLQDWAQTEFHRYDEGSVERERSYGVYLATLLTLKHDPKVTPEGVKQRLRTPRANAGYFDAIQLIKRVTRFGDTPAGSYRELLV